MSEPIHVAKFRAAHLTDGEQIAAWAAGFCKGTAHEGALIVTDRRVAFYRKGMLGEVLETIELTKITSIERKSMLGWHTTKLHTSHDAIEFSTVEKQQSVAVNDAIERGRAGRVAPKQAAGNGPLDTLKQLAELKDSGVISESEFEEKKRALLERL